MACKTLQGKYAERLEMNNKELNEKIMRAEQEYDMLKDNIHDLYEENKKLKEEKEIAIELIKRSAGYKGICTQPETDTFSKLLIILGGDKDE